MEKSGPRWRSFQLLSLRMIVFGSIAGVGFGGTMISCVSTLAILSFFDSPHIPRILSVDYICWETWSYQKGDNSWVPASMCKSLPQHDATRSVGIQLCFWHWLEIRSLGDGLLPPSSLGVYEKHYLEDMIQDPDISLLLRDLIPHLSCCFRAATCSAFGFFFPSSSSFLIFLSNLYLVNLPLWLLFAR